MILVGDSLELLRRMPDKSVDLILGSPPYEDLRGYEGTPPRAGEDWVAWMVEIVKESVRVSRGLAVYVVEGKTRKFRWSATPALLMADLHRAGVHLRKPPIFHRVGIPGSGGPDYWRNDYESCVVASRGGRLPWSDNTANGHEPIHPPGGPPSHRMSATSGYSGRDLRTRRAYKPPKLANAGNVISGPVGKGHMGSLFAHENEAPFPEWLVEPFIKCFCPPGGTVLDPFIGSGTTMKVALTHGRKGVGIDLRESQRALTLRRLAVEYPAYNPEEILVWLQPNAENAK